MIRFSAINAFIQVSRLFFILLMMASGIGKLLDMQGFYAVVESYQLLPSLLIPPAAWALTLLEIVVGLGLCVPRLWVLVTLTLPPLHVFYLLGLSSALMRGLSLSNCGCFGVFWARPLTMYSIVEDVVLLTWAVSFCWLAKRSKR